MGKTRDHFKKIRDTKGTFHAKMDTIKDKNGKDQTETEEIRKRQQEHTEELQMEVYNVVQNVVTKTIPPQKKCNSAKWLSEEAFKQLRKEER